MQNSIFQEASLQGTSFEEAQISQCAFGKAVATHGVWRNVTLEKSELSGASLDGSDFSSAKLTQINMHDVSQEKTLWDKSIFVDVKGTDPERLAAENWQPNT